MLPLSIMGSGPTSSERASKTRDVKQAVRKHFKLDEAASVFVAEIACGEADCPDVETVVAVLLEGHRREFKIRKSVDAITPQDIDALGISSD
jgi:hypothetical protein